MHRHSPKTTSSFEPRSRAAWHVERDAASTERRTGDVPAEWHHLERAHILSQPLAGLHPRTHGAMFAAAVRRRDDHELVDQALSLLFAVPGSTNGCYPVGNTGDA